ncbi:hypothetical protein PMAA_014430 [Talaromyces marneffei ATCC 18224]|uniref:Uncharacterized protein n=1 Tax=Talaromyces marneffei (strain ATCC 18224 / CBS 334.59 / QM 7333) TaxID=441960 RepID=B6QW16_TALMQ|nr:hypothetical protein PMAA_014430 [Talaromyces marneffei ATCC 18224]
MKKYTSEEELAEMQKLVSYFTANEPDMFPTSTIQVELLAITQEVKQGEYVLRLLLGLEIRLEKPTLHVFCDNKQTLGLLEKTLHNCVKSFDMSISTEAPWELLSGVEAKSELCLNVNLKGFYQISEDLSR